MSLTDREKTLITTSFAKVVPIADQAAALFYGRLFEIAPETKHLFLKTDMAEQGRKLMQMLSVVIGSLEHFDQLVPAIRSLGKRHISYGVTADQYTPVGEALIWTLGQGLGDEFTDEVRAAWLNVYTVIVGLATEAYAVKD